MCTVFPTNKTTHAIPQTKPTVHTQSTQTTSTVPRAIHPNEAVGAAPVCPPERPRSGVSTPKNIRIVCGELNDGCALAGRHGRAHRHRPYPSQPTTRGVPLSHHIVHSIAHAKPHGVFIPHRIAHSIAPNRTVCHYPIGVILSIAQGWQVQRSLPWVMM